MGCDEIRDLMALVVGGEAQENERIAVEAHVAQCRECRCDLDEYRDVRGLMTEMKEGTAPAGAIESVWTRVRDEIAPRSKPRVFAFEWAVRVAAVLVIGLALGFAVSNATRPAPSRPTADVPAPATEFMPGGGAMNAGSGGGPGTFAPGVDMRFRSVGPRKGGTKVEGNFHLPRVEKILDGDEADF
jgi:hypothetical protein